MQSIIGRLLILVPYFFLAACTSKVPSVTADLTYSNAGGFGTQNSGDYRPGSMFIWNISTNAMQFVDTLSLTRLKTAPQVGSRSSDRLSGIDLIGVPANLKGQEGAISASIGAQSTFSITDAYREDYVSHRTQLSKFVTQMIDQGDDPDLLFRPRNDDYRVVVIRSVLRAQSSNLSIGGSDASNPNSVVRIQLKSPVGEIASVNVRAGAGTTCKAAPSAKLVDLPICFFNVVVYDPTYVKGNPRLQWATNPFPQENLPKAFRSIR